MMLTVDSITGGNRERDLRTGFSIPLKLTLAGMLQFAIKPTWGINYATHERFRLPQLDEHVDMSAVGLARPSRSYPPRAFADWRIACLRNQR
jgi:L-lactate dehydrogenase (cytochrome)